jgi:type II secretion system protein J
MRFSQKSNVQSPTDGSHPMRALDFGHWTLDWRPGSRLGFTLIEMVLAIGVMALVLIAMNAVFFSAMRLRERSYIAVDESLPLQQTVAVLRRDLQGAVPPNGTLSGSFKVGGVSSPGLGLPVDIEFCTTTGALREDEPWADVQRVAYALRLPGDRSLPGKDLIRSVTRNLLAVIPPQPQEQWLAGGVTRFEIDCYDGVQWRNYWDTTLTDTNLPAAVRVRIQLAGGGDGPDASPIELIVPLESQTRTNQTVNTASGG